MKHQNNFLLGTGAAGLLLLLATLTPAGAAGTNANLVARARTAPAAAPLAVPVPELELPESTFVIPKTMNEGKDPFFPNSTRVYSTGSTTKTNTPTIVADLTLKGISGTTEQPLAIINTTTFSTGEINEVILKKGRIRIQCLEINMSAGTVLLQVGGERRELRLQR
jgi:hypothetical protein